MKKYVLLMLLSNLISVNCYAKTNSNKLITGILLSLTGAYLISDGFSEVIINKWSEQIITSKTDISNPNYLTSDVSWTKTDFSSTYWSLNHYGTVRNTGNVDLKNIQVQITYYDTNMGKLFVDYGNLTNNTLLLSQEHYDDWGELSAWEKTKAEPKYANVKLVYDYDPLYAYTYQTVNHEETKYKNELQGYIGIAFASVGIFTITDSFFEYKLSKYFIDKNINVVFGNTSNEFNFKIIRKI